ncbi:MAG: hypothetical protein LBN10_05200 [Propionibacteriaceae bacterium]|jgi:ribosomal protein L37AE/L43A|nr:hypothetical protein [Propionibacteriaceae bacterium]
MSPLAPPMAGDSWPRKNTVNHWRPLPSATYDSVKSTLRKAHRSQTAIARVREFSCAVCGKTVTLVASEGKSPLDQALAFGWAPTAAGRWLCKTCYEPWAKAARAQQMAREAAAARARQDQELQAAADLAAARRATQALEEPAPTQDTFEDFADDNPVDWRLGRWPQ